MRNKIFAALFLCLTLLPLPAAAREENGYIMKVAKSQLCRLESADAPDADAPVFLTVPDIETAELYLQMGLIEYYEPNATVYLMETENTWAQQMVQLPNALARGCTGQGVRVGVVDSGVNAHPDFGNRLLPGHNFIDGSNDTTDTHGHGTQVAGLIAGARRGMAPGAQIVPLKCFDADISTVAYVCAAITGAILNYGCDVINLSLGVYVNDTCLSDTIAYALKQNVVLVASSGNITKPAERGMYSYPASYDGVISVAAVTEQKTWPAFSQYNDRVSITAPGSGVPTIKKDGTDGNASGTSFSAPIVSGAAALALSYKPDLPRDMVGEAMEITAEDLGPVGYDNYFGYGLLQIDAFLEEISRLDKIHLMRTGEGFCIYTPADVSGRLIAAVYLTDNEISGLKTIPVQLERGYQRIGLQGIVPSGTKVFFFSGLSPLAAALPLD